LDDEDSITESVVRFSRDVMVNVVGNLLTAALLCLPAVAGGLLPLTRPLVAGSAMIVLLGLMGAVFGAGTTGGGQRRECAVRGE